MGTEISKEKGASRQDYGDWTHLDAAGRGVVQTKFGNSPGHREGVDRRRAQRRHHKRFSGEPAKGKEWVLTGTPSTEKGLEAWNAVPRGSQNEKSRERP